MKYFYKDKETIYCRKCVNFGRLNVGEEIPRKTYECKKHRVHYRLDYPLTDLQMKVVKEMAEHLKNGFDVLVFAAAGAGKTELVMDCIQTYLNKGKKVGFAISRRQVVLEICERMKKAFPTLKVIAVCEGFTEITDGDLIICTMHQLYRYHETFDLLIMDEVDAFPYRRNEMLESIAMHSCIGRIVYLTATPDEDMLKRVSEGTLKMVELFIRPHKQPVIVPQLIQANKYLQYVHLFQFLKKHQECNHQVLVFVPTIELAKKLYILLSMFFTTSYLTSKSEDKEKTMEDFRNRKQMILVSTTILERGITIKGVQVAILHSDHKVFEQASLIQMIGRVGRDFHNPTGEGIFLFENKTKDITTCVEILEKMNEALKNL